MKTIKIVGMFMAVIIALSFSACKKYLDGASVNPNSTENAGPKVILADLEVATFFNFTGGNARRAGILDQHLAGTNNQMVDLANYRILETDVMNDWNTIYSGALVNSQIIIDKYGEESPWFRGIAKILKAMNLGLATDMWGDVPNREALQGDQLNLSPHFDPQETVLSDIQTMLSEGIADLSQDVSSNALVPGGEDFIYNGDATSWIRIAYVLKARYANRLSYRSPTQSATDALSYLNSAYTAGFSSNANDAYAMFGTDGSDANQWFAFDQGWSDYIRMGKFFIDTLNATGDPRLPIYASPVDTTYVGGTTSNANAATSSNFGVYCNAEDANLPLVTFAEAKFIEAECRLRNADAAGAATAYNEAVIASLNAVTGGSDSTYVANNAMETSSSITLNKIMMQKYIALFTQIETWSDWRRTDIPSLVPNPAGAVGGIPRRLPTSRDERQYNSNATVNNDLLSHVWWDM